MRPSVQVEREVDGRWIAAVDPIGALSYGRTRAEAVRNFLVSNSVDGARLKTQGFGKQFEVAPNTTAEGRALNRRTEVILPE